MAQGEDDTLRSVCQYELNIDRLTSPTAASACSIHGINTRPAENVETPDPSEARTPPVEEFRRVMSPPPASSTWHRVPPAPPPSKAWDWGWAGLPGSDY